MTLSLLSSFVCSLWKHEYKKSLLIVRHTCRTSHPLLYNQYFNIGYRRHFSSQNMQKDDHKHTSNMVVFEKITARVFCQRPTTESESESTSTNGSSDVVVGGNPLTIFIPKTNDSNIDMNNNEIQIQLAKTCSWESVFVNPYNNGNTTTFYAPNGQIMSFCAHAAMGGSLILSSLNQSKENDNMKVSDESNQQQEKDELIQFNVNYNKSLIDTESRNNDAAHENEIEKDNKVYQYQSMIHHPHNIVSLNMEHIVWKEEMIYHPPILSRIIRTYHNITNQLLLNNIILPTFVNSNILDRTKTLICVDTIETLNNIIYPPPPPSSSSYQISCDSINTTGLYFYTPTSKNNAKQEEDDNDNDTYSYECVSHLLFVSSN